MYGGFHKNHFDVTYTKVFSSVPFVIKELVQCLVSALYDSQAAVGVAGEAGGSNGSISLRCLVFLHNAFLKFICNAGLSGDALLVLFISETCVCFPFFFFSFLFFGV